MKQQKVSKRQQMSANNEFDVSSMSNQKKQQIFPRKKNPYIKPNQVLQKIQRISAGTFGIVDKYYNKTKNQFYAVKQMQFKGIQDVQNIKQIQRQIDLLYQVSSQYCVKLYDHFQEKDNIYLVMEYVDGKNLCDGLYKPKRELPLRALCSMIDEICQGLMDLHQNKIIHRDLKLQNIMVSQNGSIKIIDLGQSNFYGDNINRKTLRGTKPYFCPQIVDREQQNDRVDVWCLGVIIYQLLCFNSPFRGNTQQQMIQNIRRFKYPIPDKIKNDKELVDLFAKIFTWKNKRISIQQVKNHPWIKRHIDDTFNQKFECLFTGLEIQNYRNYLQQQCSNYRQKLSRIKKKNKEINQKINRQKQQIYKIDQEMKLTNKAINKDYNKIYIKQNQPNLQFQSNNIYSNQQIYDDDDDDDQKQ